MDSAQHRLLIISGPVGVGKTTIAGELSILLEADDVAHTCVDMDALAGTFPRPPDDPFGNALALENLAAVWTNAKRYGSRNLIVARVMEAADDVAALSQAVGIPAPVVCLLTACNNTLLKRVRQRERGSGRAWHENRAVVLSEILERAALEDFCVATDNRPVAEIALEIRQMLPWMR